MDINIEKLIKVVKKRRGLYDSASKEYYDRVKRKQLWEEVCAQLHPSWETTDENQKMFYGREVQKKWQSLRDCFRRELVAQRNPISTKKRTKYKYFDELEFLTPFTQGISFDASEHEAAFTMQDLESSSNSKDPLAEFDSRKRKRVVSEADDETSIPREEENILKDGTNRYLDDDEAFLMSLLPGFKEYNWEEKYLLRIELMKTMLKFKRSLREQKQLRVTVKCEVDNDDDSI